MQIKISRKEAKKTEYYLKLISETFPINKEKRKELKLLAAEVRLLINIFGAIYNK